MACLTTEHPVKLPEPSEQSDSEWKHMLRAFNFLRFYMCFLKKAMILDSASPEQNGFRLLAQIKSHLPHLNYCTL